MLDNIPYAAALAVFNIACPQLLWTDDVLHTSNLMHQLYTEIRHFRVEISMPNIPPFKWASIGFASLECKANPEQRISRDDRSYLFPEFEGWPGENCSDAFWEGKQMAAITRRTAILLGGSAIAVSAFALRRLGQDEITQSERDAMSQVAENFMETFEVPGLSVTISRHGHLVYQQPFGVANRDSGEPVSTSHLFRIASVSKPITSAAIFILVQQGKIRPDDKVFGKEGILGERYGTAPYTSYMQSITVDHLLTHTCGGWDNGPGDPMFLNPTMSQGELISWTIDNRPLENLPGTHWAYSNFGYCLLGRVVEAATGQTYSEYVKSVMLAPCGIETMRISGNTIEQRAPDEVSYYGQNGEDPYDMNVQRMDSHGGWLATPTDLVRFAIHVDGFRTETNILERDTIRKMTTPCAANPHYARGWAVNERGNWWHNGSLPGTSTIIVRTSSGFCWAALTNTRRQPSAAMDAALDNMVWGMVHQVHDWRLS